MGEEGEEEEEEKGVDEMANVHRHSMSKRRR